jgi:hypothetical protein
MKILNSTIVRLLCLSFLWGIIPAVLLQIFSMTIIAIPWLWLPISVVLIIGTFMLSYRWFRGRKILWSALLMIVPLIWIFTELRRFIHVDLIGQSASTAGAIGIVYLGGVIGYVMIMLCAFIVIITLEEPHPKPHMR